MSQPRSHPRERRPPLALLAAALVTSACAAALPPYLVDPEATPHPACPPAQFIVGVGSSQQGRGDAEAQARAAVVKKLSSQIEVETDRMVNVGRRDGAAVNDHWISQNSRERGQFRHGELIKIVGSPASRGDETLVLACLDRRRAADALSADAGPLLAKFDAAAKRATAARDENDWEGFASAYREASRAIRGAFPIIVQLKALGGGAGAQGEIILSEWQEIVGTASAFRGRTVFRLRLAAKALPDEMASMVTEAVREALTSLGGTVMISESGCEGASQGTFFIDVAATAECHWGGLGHSCRPRLTAVARDCHSRRQLFDAALGDPRTLVGNDPEDEQRALKKALAKLTAASITPQLQQAFSAVLPVD